MYAGFRHWRVEDGTVDLIGAGSEWDFLPGNGLYVDLDGDLPDGYTCDPGRLVSRQRFVLRPGRYELSFRLAGSQRGDTNSVTVSLGTLFSETITLESAAPLAEFRRTITVTQLSRTPLTFAHNVDAGLDGDNGFGLILDDVSVTRQ